MRQELHRDAHKRSSRAHRVHSPTALTIRSSANTDAITCSTMQPKYYVAVMLLLMR
jgi:hypothetical protein